MLISSGKNRARCSRVPKRSIIHAAMLWIERKAAVETQPAASSSKTIAASTRPSPLPPNSSLT